MEISDHNLGTIGLCDCAYFKTKLLHALALRIYSLVERSLKMIAQTARDEYSASRNHLPNNYSSKITSI